MFVEISAFTYRVVLKYTVLSLFILMLRIIIFYCRMFSDERRARRKLQIIISIDD
jgi:hypothetical protein